MQPITSISKPVKDAFPARPETLFLLAVFQVALLLNFQKMMWQSLPFLALMIASAILVAVNYRWRWAHFASILVSFAILASRFPRQANHANLEFALELFLFGLLSCKFFKPDFEFSPDFRRSAFRVGLVTVYFYTGFHKLNADFFHPCVSCVNAINDYALSNLTGRDIVVGKGLSRLFQLAALFAELVLPFGLLFKKTRKWAALLLLTFHFYLAFTVFADFSALAVFLLLACIVDFNGKTPDAKTVRGLRLYIGFAVASVLMAPLLPKIGIAPYHFSFAHGLVYNMGLLCLLFPVFRSYRPSAQSVKKSHYPALICLVLLINLWSLKTYVGLGNAGNLTMFSNLLTEKSRSNHLLIDTQKTKLFGFEEDNLLVLELHPKLKRQKLEHYKLPLLEFRYQASKWVLKYPSVQLNCKLVYKGDTIAIADLRHSEFSKAKWWYRYVNFRKIQPEGPNGCYW